MDPVTERYRKALQEASPDEADYAALEQNRFATNLRHGAVIDSLPFELGNVLDLGCGTGLILEAMAERGRQPTFYHGVDGMVERAAPLMTRLNQRGVPGCFMLKPMEIRFEQLRFRNYDVALLVGVMGYWGYHTQAHAESIYRMMRDVAHSGAISYPMIWRPEAMGGEVRRWDVRDITNHLGVKDDNVVVLDREFVVFW